MGFENIIKRNKAIKSPTCDYRQQETSSSNLEDTHDATSTSYWLRMPTTDANGKELSTESRIVSSGKGETAVEGSSARYGSPRSGKERTIVREVD
ncbi:hypothetical protein H6P81_008001 [Aristolochia fimbriata]|uniref:Uncharacterized protein n=1 Tax=Aristolochia fimbriata TaxID=158543 RepID=A0AAV7F534_ARIFI|nr:hypothetical protein H6P81_008001 [Aristolochia fimbriata]